jgi:integrase
MYFASIMIMLGVSPKVISEMLGHASVAFTMDVYSHLIEGMQKDAVALLDKVLPEGVSTRDYAETTRLFQD